MYCVVCSFVVFVVVLIVFVVEELLAFVCVVVFGCCVFVCLWGRDFFF